MINISRINNMSVLHEWCRHRHARSY